jgi:hypothetical protein
MVLVILPITSSKIANSPRYHLLTHNNTCYNTNYQLYTILAIVSETDNPFTPLREDDIEGDLQFHNTLQQQQQATASNPNSITSVHNSVQS